MWRIVGLELDAAVLSAGRRDFSAARARAACRPWPTASRTRQSSAALEWNSRCCTMAFRRPAPQPGGSWVAVASHHHIVDYTDIGQSCTPPDARRGVGLVVVRRRCARLRSLGDHQALREARIPIDFVGGVRTRRSLIAPAGDDAMLTPPTKSMGMRASRSALMIPK